MKYVGDVWPLGTCAVSGMELGSMGDPIVFVHEGREVRFCCKGCVPQFKDSPAKFLSKADKKIIERQSDVYALENCPVSGAELGSMGEPIKKVYGNRLVKFCCAGCPPKFEEDLAESLEKMDAQIVEAKKGDYPLETCVVSGQPLDAMGGPVDYVHANELVRFCCKGCVSQFEKNPTKYMEKIHEARSAETGERKADEQKAQ
jgi:YHS domain-containing protein